MAKIYVLMGKSAVGKDTVHQKLLALAQGSLKTVIPYTTRPRRSGEEEGRDYHFLTDEAADALRAEGRIIEERCYQTVHGPWRYLTVEDGQIRLDGEEDYLLIGTLESYEKIRDFYGAEHVVPLYLYVSDHERLMRAIHREEEQAVPRYAEMCRRFLADEEDFSEEKLLAAGITEDCRYENADADTLACDLWKQISGKPVRF